MEYDTLDGQARVDRTAQDDRGWRGYVHACRHMHLSACAWIGHTKQSIPARVHALEKGAPHHDACSSFCGVLTCAAPQTRQRPLPMTVLPGQAWWGAAIQTPVAAAAAATTVSKHEKRTHATKIKLASCCALCCVMCCGCQCRVYATGRSWEHCFRRGVPVLPVLPVLLILDALDVPDQCARDSCHSTCYRPTAFKGRGKQVRTQSQLGMSNLNAGGKCIKKDSTHLGVCVELRQCLVWAAVIQLLNAAWVLLRPKRAPHQLHQKLNRQPPCHINRV